jgi:hypothetical protein
MRLSWPRFRHTARHPARAIAAIVASLLLSGHVLAAAGMCAIKAPVAASEAGQSQTEAPCPQHVADEIAPTQTPSTPSHHCPTEDPTAQPRGVDMPSAQMIVALTTMPIHAVVTADPIAAPVGVEGDPAPLPLYTRLQRLRL